MKRACVIRAYTDIIFGTRNDTESLDMESVKPFSTSIGAAISFDNFRSFNLELLCQNAVYLK